MNSSPTAELPDRVRDGQLRRTLQLEQQLDSVHQSQAQVLLTGPGIHDFLVTSTGESQRLTAFLHGYCAARRIGFVRYTMAEGIQSYPTLPGDQAAQVHRADPQHTPAQVMQQLVTDLRDGGIAAMLVFDYADGILDGNRLGLEASILCEQLQVLTADTRWHQAGLRLVLVDRGGGITTRLTGQPGMRTVHVGPPDQVELSIFARQAARASMTGRLYLENGLSTTETGRRAGGLLNLHLHEIRLTSSRARPVTAVQISDLKAAAIRDTSGGTLELMPSRVSFASGVAGLPAVRLALADAQRAGRTTLRILLSGPPGTGKTLAATAIAASLNVPAVRYGEILNEFVGVAERNMARANQVLRAMAPLVLFIDEADQVGLGARGAVVSSNEVHQNMRAALFEFLGDTGEQTGITVVATTNVPMRLDDAALSRFTILPVLFGSAAEVGQIMRIHARRLGIVLDGELAPAVAGYINSGGALSGRSALHLLESAHMQSLRANDEVVTADHVRKALAGWVGNDWTPAAEYSTLSALITARHVDAWPWVAAAMLGEAYEVPAYLRPYLIGEDKLDLDHMRARVAELSSGA
jgi:Holliday junction resolvasome RuvABC ATP-dependent DNA helicase subunit